MSNQIFKQDISKNIILTFLNNYAEQDERFYIFSKTNFRQAEFHNAIEPLCTYIKPYYHKSKQYYIERKLTYSKFITILRQLCKLVELSYTSRIIYSNSTYNIVYYISKN